MGVSSYPVGSVIERLDALAALKFVGVAPDLVHATNEAPKAVPAAYVLSETRGGPIKFTGPPLQQDRTTFIKVIVWVRNHGTAAAVRAEADAIVEAIDKQLSGWAPANPAFAGLTLSSLSDEFARGPYLVVLAKFQASWNFSA